jgi:putative membrane-bound dehydrogenase-like protein
MSTSRVHLLPLLCLALAAGAFAQPKDDTPKAPPGWKVEGLARAPKIQHPSVVCCAPDGRIFVGEDPVDMHLPSGAEADRILCFHPDGRVTVFAEKLHAVYGLLYLDGKLYVHHTPKLSVFADDGTGVGKDRTDLFDCTNPDPWNTHGFNDHIPAQIRLAMDGFIYMSVGDKGVYGMVGKDGKKAELRGGGVVRFRPDGTDLEVFSSGTRNHLDMSINAEDDLFTWDNTDDGRGWWTRFTHIVDGGFYGYPWDYWPNDPTPQKVEEQIKSGKPGQPYTLWRMAEYGGGSPCGAVGYNEDGLPAEYRANNLFHCEWGKGHVARFVVERAGGSYKVVKREEFLTPGGEFRPLGITVTPDGMGFLVTDWNFGGWKQASEGGKRGRLIRVTWAGKSEAAPRPYWYVAAGTGKPFRASNEELIEALMHPAQSVRLVAQRRLSERGDDVVKPLRALLKDAKAPAHARWHAIWALDGIGKHLAGCSANAEVLRDRSTDPSVRRQAAKWFGTRRVRSSTAILSEALRDPDPSVRFQVATALGRIGSAGSVNDILSTLAEKDFFTGYALFHALNRIGRADPTAWPAIAIGLSSDDAVIRQRTAFAVRETYDAVLVRSLGGFAADTSKGADARAAAVAALATLHRQPKPWDGKWWGTQPVLSPPPKKEVAWEGTPVVVKALRDGLKDPAPQVRLAAVKGLQVAPDPEVGDVLARMFRDDSSPTSRRDVLRAIAACKPDAAAGLVEQILLDPKADEALVPEAVAIAEKARGSQMTGVLGRAAESTKPALAVAALRALTRMKDRSAVAVASKLVTDSLRDAQVRRAAAASLAASQSPDAVEPLLKAHADPEVRADVILALASIPDVRALDAYLEGLDSRDGTLRQRCREALKVIAGRALPLVEAKLDKQTFSTQVIADLQAVFTAHQPVREWRVLAPWRSDDPDPVALADRRPRGVVKTPDGRELRWRTMKGRGAEGMVDLGSENSSEAYCVAEINSDVQRAVQLLVGSDDRMTLYLNGDKIHEDLRDGGWSPDEATVAATLKAGRNLLVAKVGNTGGGWMFSVAVSGEQKGKLFQYDTGSLDPALYADHALKHKGDANNGRKVFAATGGAQCIKCHQVNGEGGEAGPALTGVGSRYDRAKLIESVLYPSKQIFDGYEQTLVRTKDGNTYAGAVRGETDGELTLIDAENRKTVIRKSDVDRRKVSELSLMPEGLYTALKPEEFTDLIAYLESLKDPGPTGNGSKN